MIRSLVFVFFFSSRRRHTRFKCDWSSDVCSSDLKLLSSLTINSFAGFTPNKAKQMVPCSYDGYVIGDGILFHLDKDELLFVGRTPTVNWIQFHAQTGGYKVQAIRDDRSPSHPRGKPVFRQHYRY